MVFNHLLVATMKNACIIHSTKSDVQLHHTQITSSGICTNIYVLFLTVSNIKFKSPVCFIYVTQHSLKGMDFFLFCVALWLSVESRLLIFPTMADGLRKCAKQLSLQHSILSYIIIHIQKHSNVQIMLFIYSFSQPKSYSATNVQQQFCILSEGYTPGKLIYNAYPYNRDYPDISAEQDCRLLSSQHKQRNTLPCSASSIET